MGVFRSEPLAGMAWSGSRVRQGPYEKRIIDARQELICRHAPEKALAALPQLLSAPADRRRFLSLLDAVQKKAQLESTQLGVTAEQRSMLKRIRKLLSAKGLSAAA